MLWLVWSSFQATKKLSPSSFNRAIFLSYHSCVHWATLSVPPSRTFLALTLANCFCIKWFWPSWLSTCLHMQINHFILPQFKVTLLLLEHLGHYSINNWPNFNHCVSGYREAVEEGDEGMAGWKWSRQNTHNVYWLNFILYGWSHGAKQSQ